MSDWRKLLKSNFTNADKLAAFLELSEEQKAKILKTPRFILNLPYRLAAKMAKGTLEDPLFRQFVPLIDEEFQAIGFQVDPTEDKSYRKSEKLLQKYEGRALIVTTSACAMHCRFCFRQNFPYETERKSFAIELKAIEEDPSIKEVILSGGDPLSLSNELLGELIGELSKLIHVKRIRFHTRFPIGIPERIDEMFLQMIATCPKQIYFVLHCNHVRELDADIFERMGALRRAGAVLLNQSVLLKGVNDQLSDLQELTEKLADHGILPYYLHQLDQVQGAHHFEVKRQRGLELMEQLTAKLSGYAVPKYVKEIPQKKSKTALHFFNGMNP